MIGHALCWTAIAFGLTIVLPGGSYLGIVPAVALAFGVLLLSVEMAAVVAATFTALIWIPIIATLYELAGHVTLPAIAAGVALMATSFTPIVSLLTPTHRAAVAAMLTTAAACLVMQLLIPAYTAESPRRMNIQYVDDDGTPRWNIGNLPAPPPPRLSLSPPECGASASAGLTTLRCRSTRGANRFTLLFYAPDLIGLRINGVTPPQQPPKFRQRLAPGWHLVSIRGTPEAQIEITLRKSHSLNAQISDRSFTLPPEAAPILRARAAAHGVPSDEGDGIVVRRRLRL